MKVVLLGFPNCREILFQPITVSDSVLAQMRGTVTRVPSKVAGTLTVLADKRIYDHSVQEFHKQGKRLHSLGKPMKPEGKQAHAFIGSW